MHEKAMWNFFQRSKQPKAVADVSAEALAQAEKTRKWDRQFENYRRDHPGASFAQFYVDLALKTIKSGEAHSTLGLCLQGESDFHEAGQDAFDRYRRLLGIGRAHKVVDYGCGSLRLGIHFIEYLARGHYTGLDVTRDFVDIGAGAAKALIEDKQPELDAIDPQSIEKAASFQADFIVSNAVSYHVHPDETDAYFSSLAKICAKPGATLAFDAKIAATPTRFRQRGWAWPLEYYVERLKPLALVEVHKLVALKDERASAVAIQSGVLEFRRL